MPPPSQALIARRAARRAAPPPPAEPFRDGIGRDVYVKGLVSDLLQVVGALDADVLRCIAEYYVDGGKVACVVSGLGYKAHSFTAKLTTKIGQVEDGIASLDLGYNIPPMELTLRNPTTGSRELLHKEQDVGSLLHFLGFSWQLVLREPFHLRPTLHLERRFRHY
jgi:hypothetical protein